MLYRTPWFLERMALAYATSGGKNGTAQVTVNWFCRFSRVSVTAALPPRRFRHRAPPRFLGRTKAQYLDLLTRTNTRACAFVAFLAVPCIGLWSWRYVTVLKPAKETAKQKVRWQIRFYPLVFSKVDLAKAFHQILIDKRDRHKTAIATQWGMFNFRRLSMGLQNSAQSFQRLVDTALKDVPNTSLVNLRA